MNKVILMGRLTREPGVTYSTSQDGTSTTIARYTLAVDRKYKTDNTDNTATADFIPCVAFGRIGEFAEKYLHKGTKVVVTGRIQTGSYVNREGVKVYTTDVIVEECEFAESKASQNTGEQGRPEPTQAEPDGFMQIPDGVEDEGLPFN